MLCVCTSSLYDTSAQDLYKTSVGKISVRDLRSRSLQRSLEEVSWQDLLDKISKRDLLAISFLKIPVQDLYRSSVGNIPVRSVKGLMARSLQQDLYAMSLYKVSTRKGALVISLNKISIRGLLARSL